MSWPSAAVGRGLVDTREGCGPQHRQRIEARVGFSGVEAYAHSELEEAVMHAVVEAPTSADKAL